MHCHRLTAANVPARAASRHDPWHPMSLVSRTPVLTAIALGILGLSLMYAPAQAEVFIVSSMRDVSTFAMISYPGEENPFCSDEIESTETGSFAEDLICEVEDQGNSATGNASQLSYILPDRLMAEGAIDAFADVSGGADFAEGFGGTDYRTHFYVDATTEVRLQATLFASGNGTSNLVLRVYNADILLYRSLYQESAEIDEFFTLEPGSYELSFNCGGFGQALAEGGGEPALASFSGSLLLPASAVTELPAGGRLPVDLSAAPRAVPNPLRTTTTLFAPAGAARPGEAIAIFDAAGRVVRRFRDVGPAGVTWDARDAQGRPVETGLYLVRAATRGPATRLVVLR